VTGLKISISAFPVFSIKAFKTTSSSSQSGRHLVLSCVAKYCTDCRCGFKDNTGPGSNKNFVNHLWTILKWFALSTQLCLLAWIWYC